jgi:glycosyltransferase involved in cell wall biosynthesis
MRILMLSQFFYPPTIGGQERHVADLSRELAARGHGVTVVTLQQKGFPPFEIKRGVSIYRIGGTMQRVGMLFSESDRRYAPPSPDPEVVFALRRLILQERPDIVHAHDWMAHSFTPLKAWSKARLIVSLHSYGLVCVQKRLMRHEVGCTGPGFSKCLRCATEFYGLLKGPPSALAHRFWSQRERRAVDLFLPVSQAVAEGNQLTKARLPYRVIPNFIPDQAGVACDEAHPLLAQLPKGDFLLFVGDVTRDKGAEVLLRAYSELDTRVPLVLIGRPLLPGLAKHLPPNVLLLGGWPHDAVMAAWRRCSLALVPSIVADSCPTVAIEAMSMGKPVVASRIGGLPDMVIDGQTGDLVSPGDPHELREAIRGLLADPGRRERMGSSAKQHAAAFQAASVVARIEHAYQEVLNEGSFDARLLARTRGR